MFGLDRIGADLDHHRRRMEEFLQSAMAAAWDMTAGAMSGPGRLVEVADFGPNPGRLRMLAHVPSALQAAAPLVVVLHGCDQTAAGYDRGAGWSALADRLRFAVLLPEQRRENNPNACFGWFDAGHTSRDRGEALSVRQMVERMVIDHGLDRGRVFVTGLSAGGAMAAALLAAYPDVFAGGGIIAGLPYRSATNPHEAFERMHRAERRPARAWGDLVRAAAPRGFRGPWPRVSIWHGTADATVDPANAAELVSQWTDVHGLGPDRAAQDTVDGHPRRVWLGPDGEPLVESYTVRGAAHGAPVALGGGGGAPFFPDAGISSTCHIARFWGLTAKASEG